LARTTSRSVQYRLAEDAGHILEGASSNTRASARRPYHFLKAVYHSGTTRSISSHQHIRTFAEFPVRQDNKSRSSLVFSNIIAQGRPFLPFESGEGNKHLEANAIYIRMIQKYGCLLSLWCYILAGASSSTRAIARQSHDCPMKLSISLKLHTLHLDIDISVRLWCGRSQRRESLVSSIDIVQGRPFLSGSQLVKIFQQAFGGQRVSYTYMDIGIEGSACYLVWWPVPIASRSRLVWLLRLARPAWPVQCIQAWSPAGCRYTIAWFSAIYLLEQCGQLSTGLFGKSALQSLYYTCASIHGLVCGSLSHIIASPLTNSQFLLCQWTCNPICFMCTIQTHVFYGLMSRIGDASLLRKCLYVTAVEAGAGVAHNICSLSGAFVDPEILPEVGGYCAMVRTWSC
jgi:hypothetical protein